MIQQPPPIPVLLQQLSHYVDDLERLVEDADHIDWRHRPAPDSWSLVEIVCHLRDVELEVHQPRIRAIVDEEMPFIPGVNPDSWAEPRRYREEEGDEAFAQCLSARRETVTLLSGLEPGQWQRRGRHAFLGTTTLQELVYLIVNHDEAHWLQAAALLPGASEEE